MPPQSSSPTGRGEPGWPASGRTAGDWPDDDWPDDDEPDPNWPDPADWPVAARAAVRDGWRRRFLAVAAVAVVAAAVGAGIALIASPGPSASPAASSGAAQTSPTPFTRPGQASGSGGIPGGGLPSGGLPKGAVARMMVGGQVLAVSTTSVTINGGGHSVVAAVTRSTRFTGRAKGIGSVKVGDMIAAEMTMSGSKITAVTIQDPAEALPIGGNAPGAS